MADLQEFKQILIKSQANNNTERTENEVKLKQIRSQDTIKFIQLLMMVVNHSDN